jgi:NAD(P)H-dependent FMN reductase
VETVTDVGIIIGSTRPGRIGLGVARWVYEVAQRRSDARYELVDIADYNLPLLDEPEPPSTGNYRNEHTKRWSAKVASLDAFVFVTPEYNHGTSAALKNALDFLYAEWNNKAAGFVGYGNAGAARALEQLRAIVGELQIADVHTQVALSIFTDFERYTTLKRPVAAHHERALSAMLDQVVRWATALGPLRA